MKLIEDLIRDVGWHRMYEIAKNKPIDATHYMNDQYIKNFKYDDHGCGFDRWMSLFNEWAHITSNGLVYAIYDISNIKEYAFAYQMISNHGGIAESNYILKTGAYVYDKAYFLLQDCVKKFNDVGHPCDWYIDD